MPRSVEKLNFVGGEWSPSLYARTDLEKYNTACRLMRNFFAHPYGGASNRAGTIHVAETYDPTKITRLIPFQFSTEQSYVLELGDQIMRVIVDGGLVVETPGAGTDIVESGTYKWTASGSGTNEYYCELAAGGDPSLALPEYVFEDVGGDDTYMPEGTLGSLAAGEYAYGDNDSLGFSTIYVRLSDNVDPDTKADGYLEASYVFTLVIPYDDDDLALLKFTQSADTMYLCHPSYAPRKLTRTANDAWQINTVTFAAGIAAPTGLSMDGTGTQYVVTAISSIGEESIASTNEEGAPGNTLTWTAVTGAVYYNVYKDDYGSGVYGYIGQASSNTFSEPAAGIEPDFSKVPPSNNNPFSASDDYPGVAEFFEQRIVYARTNNAPQTFWGSVIGAFDNMNISIPSQDSDSYEFTLNSKQVNEVRWLVGLRELIIGTSGSEWKADGGGSAITPSNIDVKVQSRIGSSHVPPLVIANNILFVQSSGSKVRDFAYSFDSDGYKGDDITIFAEHLFRNYEITEWAYQQDPDSIIWCIRDDGMLLGLTYYKDQQVWGWHQHVTEGDFKSVAAIRDDDGKDEIYFVVEREINGSTTKHIEKLAERLPARDDYVVDIQDAFFVDDGLSLDDPVTITGITKADPAVVTAAGHGFSNGDFVDIVEVQGMTEVNDTRFKITNVTTNTFSLQDESGNDIDSSAYTAYKSSGKVRKCYTTLAGLDHLEGEDVAVLSNGNVVKGLTVTSGQITLPHCASRVHIGLPYTADLDTLDFDYEVPSGPTVQDKIRNIISAVLRFDKTRALWVGPNEDRLNEIPFRTDEDYGQPTALFTGDKEVFVEAGEEREGRLYFRNEDPLPVSILGVIAREDNGEN